MNPAITAALAAANKQQASSAELLAQMKKAGAHSKATAIAPDLSAKGADKVLRKLVEDGYLRAAGDGRYFADRERVAENAATARNVALVMLAFLLSAGASLVALLVRAG
ncbi:hypothetical protein [Sphingomonas astaxanthinifaciens]|uniref:Uncharacterized protein n=1 Tax=Sphingomonas astaxanthinifaciens DSM 22298 TaxID=1123267 RepID=A0ABQ5Z5V8_9SPHN|nr:hypothetical protein [Sphingomonas astaxanthinifaciens]GLR48163.1 hypothetical protein GCM10007925_18760 [Sphingomonas astaxanthinifaciens DSM 22298]